MRFQALNVESGGVPGPLLQSPIVRNSSWCKSNSNTLTVNEADDQLPHKHNSAIGSMNLDELLQDMSNPEIEQPIISMDMDNVSSALPLQHEGRLANNRATSKKTTDEIWREIQQGDVANNGMVVKTEKDLMTLEDFLTKSGAYSGEECSKSPVMALNTVDTRRSFSAHINSLPAPSIGVLLDSPLSGHKRNASDSLDRIDRKLRRKIKNRESAARSRARKQAYHNELVSKVSCLELENIKLKKEKEFEKLFSNADSDETKYQLRRTSSTSF